MRTSDEELDKAIRSFNGDGPLFFSENVLLDLRDLRAAIRKHMEDLGTIGKIDSDVDAELYAHLSVEPAPVQIKE